MNKKAQGRPLMCRALEGTALVSRPAFDPYLNLLCSTKRKFHHAVCKERGNLDLYGNSLQGKILCVSSLAGPEEGICALSYLIRKGKGPSALLISSTDNGPALLLRELQGEGSPFVLIDGLGNGFLDEVRTGSRLRIRERGEVEIVK